VISILSMTLRDNGPVSWGVRCWFSVSWSTGRPLSFSWRASQVFSNGSRVLDINCRSRSWKDGELEI
jgi:hypothetical protein